MSSNNKSIGQRVASAILAVALTLPFVGAKNASADTVQIDTDQKTSLQKGGVSLGLDINTIMAKSPDLKKCVDQIMEKSGGKIKLGDLDNPNKKMELANAAGDIKFGKNNPELIGEKHSECVVNDQGKITSSWRAKFDGSKSGMSNNTSATTQQNSR